MSAFGRDLPHGCYAFLTSYALLSIDSIIQGSLLIFLGGADSMIRELASNFASDFGLSWPFYPSLVPKRNVGAKYDDETIADAIVRSPNGSS